MEKISNSQSLGVATYELSKLIPEDFKVSPPSIDEIENELRKDTEEGKGSYEYFGDW